MNAEKQRFTKGPTGNRHLDKATVVGNKAKANNAAYISPHSA